MAIVFLCEQLDTSWLRDESHTFLWLPIDTKLVQVYLLFRQQRGSVHVRREQRRGGVRGGGGVRPRQHLQLRL